MLTINFKKIFLTVVALKELNTMEIWLSHLWGQKFKNSFQVFLNPVDSCDEYVETSSYYFLYSPNYLRKDDPLKFSQAYWSQYFRSALIKQNSVLWSKK